MSAQHIKYHGLGMFIFYQRSVNSIISKASSFKIWTTFTAYELQRDKSYMAMQDWLLLKERLLIALPQKYMILWIRNARSYRNSNLCCLLQTKRIMRQIKGNMMESMKNFKKNYLLCWKLTGYKFYIVFLRRMIYIHINYYRTECFNGRSILFLCQFSTAWDNLQSSFKILFFFFFSWAGNNARSLNSS